MTRVVLTLAREFLVVSLFALAALLGLVSGVLFVYAGDVPEISALDDYAPSTITRVHAADGTVLDEFATQRRVVIRHDQISPRLRQAIVSSEDREFDSHFGLSVQRIVIALVKDLLERRMASGASTLTQQLARNLFPDTIGFEKTWERKIKEAIVAIQIEKRFTKPEIFTLYCNQIYLGHGAYGVEAASRLYFGKPAKDLSLSEAALIAGIIQTPSRQSPYVDMERARSRRSYALSRMAEDGYITEAEAEAARQSPIVTVGLPAQENAPAPYFVEEVRKHIESSFGAKALYESGLTVRTPLDLALQRAATLALQDGLRQIDKRRGWRPPKRTVLASGDGIDTASFARWKQPMQPGDVVPGVVRTAEAARIVVRVGGTDVEIGRDGFAWTGRVRGTDLVKPGDVVDVRLGAPPAEGGTGRATLEQAPVVEGAVVAVENHSGNVLAMVGGYSFERSKFNRAVQAMRQLGSTFKPVVYAAAVDRGFTPASILLDEPVSFPDGAGRAYAPSNYDNRFYGPLTLRRALEQSRNVPAVRLMDALGPKTVLAYARRLGFTADFPPYLSTALGAGESTLLEVTSAFSAFPHQGVRMAPRTITTIVDREGNLVEENRPQPDDALRADTAYVMTSLLQGVVLRGTAARAAALDWPLGGKTGTTNDYTDAWFVGFDPDITVGVWVGYDQKRPIGPSESGSAAALPIWMDIMRAWIATRAERPAFAPPGNVVLVAVDPATGTPATAGTPGTIPEVFISGTQPESGIIP